MKTAQKCGLLMGSYTVTLDQLKNLWTEARSGIGMVSSIGKMALPSKKLMGQKYGAKMVYGIE